jgi:hypothetical protein
MTTDDRPNKDLEKNDLVFDPEDERALKLIHALVEACGGSPENLDGSLVTQLIQNSLRLMSEKHDSGQLKLMTRALKEMRYAYRIFNRYPNVKRISIFGSARTPEDHPDYLTAKAFSLGMADQGWMCITGAANGIMKAGLEGSKRQSSFGLSIRLPFEIPTNSFIEGDTKLMIFRYFFTRKLMFISHSDAIAVFPGGFGTLDELFEVLTLLHNGKSSIVPLVLIEGNPGVYWKFWEEYIQKHLLDNGWISPEDRNLYYIASSPEDAVKHIQHFYSCYHSSRYVKDIFVLRLQRPLDSAQVEHLNQKFAILVQSGTMQMSSPLTEETDYLELPRLIFHHTRKDFGILRLLIDEINNFKV